MAKKQTSSRSPRRVSRVKREALPALDTTPTQTTCSSSSCNFTLWVWVLAILVILGFAFKGKLSCGLGQGSVKVKTLGMVSTETLEGGPYQPTYLCGLDKGKYAVSDESHTRILVMGLDGKLLNVFGKKGERRSQLHHNTGVTTDGAGNIYVLDHETADVFGYNQEGDIFLRVDSRPTGFFYGPRGLAYLKGNFVIADTGSCRVVIMDPAGSTVAKWGGRGNKPAEFVSPNAVVVTSKGKLVVSDYDNKRFKIQDANGTVLKVVDLPEKPAAIAVDGKDRLFVSYATERFIDVFNTTNGRRLGKVVVQDPPKDLNYRNISALGVAEGDKLLAADASRIWVYQL